jgi:hypothetical protein
MSSQLQWAVKSLREGSGKRTLYAGMWSVSPALYYGTIPILSKDRWQPDAGTSVLKEIGK